MKKTQIIELLNTIKRTMVSFIAILLFITAGVALYTGLSWGGKALDDSANRDFDLFNFRDLDLYFAYGLDPQALSAFEEIEGVDLVEGLNNTYPFFYHNGIKKQAKVTTATELVDRFSYVEGTFPVGAFEIAVERHWAEENGISIGDTVVFEHDDDGSAYLLKYVLDQRYIALLNPTPTEDGMKYLRSDTFKVTALVTSPAYMSVVPLTYGVSSVTSTPIDCIMFVNAEAFDEDAFLGYSDLLIHSKALGGRRSSSDEYRADVQVLKERVLTVANKLQQERYKKLKASIEQIEHLQLIPQEIRDLAKNVKEYDCIAFTRDNNGGQVAIASIADVYEKIRYSMVTLFVVIGLLVCYAAVSRIVYEQTLLIGTKKALGLTDREITLTFVIYSFTAVTIGLILGLIFGYLIEYGLLSVTSINYMITQLIYVFSLRDALLIGIVEFSLIMLATLIACRNILKRDVVGLLTGNDEKLFKPKKFEKTFLWKRMPVINKAIFKNFSNDKRRIFSTLVSVIGCTALVVCALGFSNGITKSFDTQFNKIQSFDAFVYYDHTVEGGAEEIEQIIQGTGYEYVQSYMSIGSIKTVDQKTVPSYLFTFDEKADRLGLIALYSVDGQKHDIVESADEGAWVSAAFATEYGLEVGDTVFFSDSKGREVPLLIDGIYNYYLQHTQIVLTPAAFEKAFGEVAQNNVFVVNSGRTGLTQLQQKLSETDGYILTEDYFKSAKRSFDIVAIVCNVVTIVYLALSVCMAVLVLLNMFTMHVQEKKRELITLMVNGFYRHDAKRYIYTDSIVLTAIGIVLGAGLGLVIARLSLMSLMTDSTYPLLETSWAACGIGAAVSIVLTVLMCFVALRRIDRFKLTDINVI